jgi:hypothetical protein
MCCRIASRLWCIEGWDPAFIAHYRHKAKLADGIDDGIASIGLTKLYLCQWVTTPGDY